MIGINRRLASSREQEKKDRAERLAQRMSHNQKKYSKVKKAVGSSKSLDEAANLDVISTGGMKQRKLTFGPSTIITTNVGQDMALSLA
jgi:hypothetical protein